MNLEEAQVFIEANKVAITDENKFGRCVDGRYENIIDCPMIAKPGGDAGDVMAVFGALNILGKSLPNETVLELVLENIGGSSHFNFHSDDHADAAVAGLGCGHLKQAKLDPSAYGLLQEQIDTIFAELPAMLEQGAHQEVLHGDHAEQAVIVVDSESYGAMPLLRSEDKLSEAFIYQKTWHEKQLDKLSQGIQMEFAKTGVVLEEAEVRNALDTAFGKQLGETLKRLASGLPVYVAKISESSEVSISE